jgi:hypothetical protein
MNDLTNIISYSPFILSARLIRDLFKHLLKRLIRHDDLGNTMQDSILKYEFTRLGNCVLNAYAKDCLGFVHWGEKTSEEHPEQRAHHPTDQEKQPTPPSSDEHIPEYNTVLYVIHNLSALTLKIIRDRINDCNCK